MSVILLDEAMAYLRMSPSSTNGDEAVLQATIDTAESLVAKRVGPLASGAQS